MVMNMAVYIEYYFLLFNLEFKLKIFLYFLKFIKIINAYYYFN